MALSASRSRGVLESWSPGSWSPPRLRPRPLQRSSASRLLQTKRRSRPPAFARGGTVFSVGIKRLTTNARTLPPTLAHRQKQPANAEIRAARSSVRRSHRARLAMVATARTHRFGRNAGWCGANRCALFSVLFTLAWLAWGPDENGRASAKALRNFSVPVQLQALVRPHVQKADLAGFLDAHARHDPARALQKNAFLRSRKHGGGFQATGSAGSVDAAFRAWEDAHEARDERYDSEDSRTESRENSKTHTKTEFSTYVISTKPDPHPLDVLAPAHPEPPSLPPRPDIRFRHKNAPGAHFWGTVEESRRGGLVHEDR